MRIVTRVDGEHAEAQADLRGGSVIARQPLPPSAKAL
jgi:hypothetical protein